MTGLIPNISQEISHVLKKINFKPSISPGEFIRKTKGEKHRYLSLCADKRGRKLIFYARLHKNPDAKRKMMTEISFLKKLKEKRIKSRIKISKYIPELYLAKIERDFEWFTREYFPYSPLGTNEKLKKKIKKGDVPVLAEAVYLIKNTPRSMLKDVTLKKFPFKNYLKVQNSISYLQDKKILNKKLSEKIIRRFQKNKGLLKKENKYLSHGDFNLGNLIIYKGNLKILDWESVEINNSAFDIAYLFSHLWQARKEIRKKLIKYYLKLLSQKERITFKKNFPIVIFYLAVGGLEAKPVEISPSLLKKRKEFFKKLLKGASFGFNKLISV